MRLRTCAWAVVLAGIGASAGGPFSARAQSNRAPSPAALDIYQHTIRPLLRERCVSCHGPARQEVGLRLDTGSAILRGGDAGPAVEPQSPERSPLWRRVAESTTEARMPPEGAPLRAEQIAAIRDWIAAGAPYPRDEAPLPDPTSHWAFQPIRAPTPPAVQAASWPRNGIDAFVLARLEAAGLAPSPEASPATLARRVTLDLTGLPPTPEELAEFLAESHVEGRPDAYERLVDRLLASPHYAERWARPWLDIARFADTDGYLTDQARPVAWRYRQWLLDSLAVDLPFDQFTVEQLAGDLLPDATLEQRLATGFLRNTLSNREGGADLEEYRVEQVIDRVQMIGATWLGLTLGCARCHDHKYDPLPQAEFYSLVAILDVADEVNIDAPLPGEAAPRGAALAEFQRQREELLRPVLAEVDALQREWERRLLEARDHPGDAPLWDRQWEVLGLVWGGHLGEGQLEGTRIAALAPERRTTDESQRLQEYFLSHGSLVAAERWPELRLGELSGKLAKLRAELPPVTRAPVMCQSRPPRSLPLHTRGDFRRPGGLVAPGTPSCLPACPPTAEASPIDRLALARWLVSNEQPLTPRVVVNRHWQELFGRGLVATPGDFGVRGEPPSHPELLDWLAAEFRGPAAWSTRRLHRLIVTSATYRQSSRPRPEFAERDPENRLLARQTPLRFTAEQVRDTALAVSGLLDERVGGPSVFPPQPESVAAEGFSNTWKESAGGDRYRRGLYTWLQRLSPFAQGLAFDAPPPNQSCVRRERSNTPLQALTLLNDPVFYEAAAALGRRLQQEIPGADSTDRGTTALDRRRIERATRLCLGRAPTAEESSRLLGYLDTQRAILAAEQRPPDEAWTLLSSVLLNLHEAITRD